MKRGSIPVVFITFNRPECAKLSFRAIKKYKPKKLFLIVDGPRKNHRNDNINCGKVKKIISNINWNCKVYKNFSSRNLGIKKRIITGLDWVFLKTEFAIVIEDDCLVNRSFFNFCELMLNKYNNNNKVFMISGTNFINNFYKKSDYLFSNFGSFWGWATWKRSWRKYRHKKNFWLNFKKNIDWSSYNFNNEMINHWINIFDKVYLKKYNTWDYQCWASMWKNKSYAIVPRLNMVTNIGFGPQSTHYKDINLKKNFSLKSKKFKVVNFNKNITHNSEYDNKLFFNIFGKKNFYQNIKLRIYNIIVNFLMYKKNYKLLNK
jgi:hypothetical protein